MEKDQYDEQIERLTANPHLIESEWMYSKGFFSGRGHTFGICISMIKSGYYPSSEVKGGIFKEIRDDARIPSHASEITLASLPVFAEWKRKLDSLALPQEILRRERGAAQGSEVEMTAVDFAPKVGAEHAEK